MRFDMLYSSLFVRLHFGEQCSDAVEFLRKHILQRCALLLAEADEGGQCFFDGLLEQCPFLIAERLLHGVDFKHIRKTQDGGHHFCRQVAISISSQSEVDMRFVVICVIRHRLPIDRGETAGGSRCCVGVDGLRIDRYIYFTALQRFRKHCTNVGFAFAEKGRGFQAQIQLLAVERTYFYDGFVVRKAVFCFSIPSHG